MGFCLEYAVLGVVRKGGGSCCKGRDSARNFAGKLPRLEGVEVLKIGNNPRGEDGLKARRGVLNLPRLPRRRLDYWERRGATCPKEGTATGTKELFFA